MSLYGSGRREGVLAVLAVVAITTAVHLLGAVLGDDALGRAGGETVRNGLYLAATPALAGITFYRFLKSLRRSRYAAFLGAAAYALSPWLCATAAMPREQLAAALAPLALEAACRTARPDDRRRWLPWAGLCIAAPFFAGITTTALLASTVALLRLIGGTVELRRDEDERRYGLVLLAVFGAGLLGTSLVLIDPGTRWLLTGSLPTTVEVLAAHREPGLGLDAAAFLRLPGPVVLLFAVLGLLRNQRHVSRLGWTIVALVGAAPTVLLEVVPDLPDVLAELPAVVIVIPAATFWLSLVATTVLGAAGLDDFLETPVRRRFALPLLLGLLVIGTTLMMLHTPAPAREWPLVTTIFLLTILLPAWRSLGLLRFKNVLGAVAMLALLVPAIQVLTVNGRPLPGNLPAAPGAEVLYSLPASVWQHLATRPAWHYAGACGALLCALVAWLRRPRRTSASPAPARAKAAIAKKAPPPKRR